MIHGYTLTDTKDAQGSKQEIFERANAQFGFVPNIINAFSESPVLANAMLDLYTRLGDTNLSFVESHVVLQTINVQNKCTYCVPAHSTIARSKGVDTGLDEALRVQHRLDDPKLEALRLFTSQMVEQRGHFDDGQFQAFLEAGYTREHALEVIYLHTVKTLTNYGNHLAGTDLDKPFQALEWTPEEAVAV